MAFVSGRLGSRGDGRHDEEIPPNYACCLTLSSHALLGDVCHRPWCGIVIPEQSPSGLVCDLP
jgi:hypothetical protein